MNNINENQMLVLEYMEKVQKKLSFTNLKKHFKISGDNEIASFSHDLEDLRLKGKIFLNNGSYQLFTDDLDLHQGEIIINDSGRGYVKIDKEKFFVPREKLNGALNKDIVIIKTIHEEKGHAIAEVIQVVRRNSKILVCEVNEDNEIVPIRSKYNINLNVTNHLKLVPGDRVTVLLGNKNSDGYNAEVDKLIGHADDLNIELNTIAYEFGFDNEIPEDAIKQLETIPTKVTDKDTDGRVDYTEDKVFTIDGNDTKDIDDAISIETDSNGNYLLRVHIADVSHYVKEKTPLYRLALDRGTSLYLVNGVIPMLPHQLSNGICSLNEGVPRLTKTCEMLIDKDNGELIDFNINKSVINSNKKMNYADVNSIVENGIVPMGYGKFVDSLEIFKNFSLLCNKVRRNRKTLNFSSMENDIKMEGDTPVGFAIKRRGLSEVMIENAMVRANETVAMMMYYMDVPFIYRIHDIPDARQFNKSLNELKKLYMFRKYANLMTIQDIDRLLEKAKGTEDFDVISQLILRQLNRAKYTAYNDNHYGLGLRFYTHFTSPIRRLPDLIVHSLLDRYFNEYNFEGLEDLEKDIAISAAHASYKERQANNAEKAAEKMEMAKYLEDNFEYLKNQDIEARINWIDKYYTSVQLNNGITGKLNFSHLSYNDHSRYLVGRENGQKVCYKIGDKVRVRLEKASAKDRTVEFTLQGLIKNEIKPIPILEPIKKGKIQKVKSLKA